MRMIQRGSGAVRVRAFPKYVWLSLCASDQFLASAAPLVASVMGCAPGMPEAMNSDIEARNAHCRRSQMQPGPFRVPSKLGMVVGVFIANGPNSHPGPRQRTRTVASTASVIHRMAHVAPTYLLHCQMDFLLVPFGIMV